MRAFEMALWPLPRIAAVVLAAIALSACTESAAEPQPGPSAGTTVCSEASPCVYVTADGAGTQDGTDWTNASAGLPSSEVHTYLGLPLAELERGVTYLVADGTYPGCVLPAVPGTEPITIKKATTADHGTSVGWTDDMGDGEAVFEAESSVWVFSPSAKHIHLDGQVGTGKSPGGYGFRLYSTAERGAGVDMVTIDTTGLYDDVGDVSQIEISHVEIDWDNGTSAGPCGHSTGFEIHGAKPNSHWTVFDCYVHHASGGVAYLRNGGHYEFRNCYFQLMGDETESGACPGAPDHGHWETFWITIDEDLQLEGNVFEDAYGAGQTGWVIMEASSVVVRDNLFFCSAPERCHVGGNGVIGAWSDSYNSDVLITHNTFRDFFHGAHYLFEQGSNIVITDNTYENAPGLEDDP
jgi:hypothetical protein